MEIKAYFKEIQDIILYELTHAKSHISIAVAWFTNNVLFAKVIELQNKGVTVELIILNDDINHRIGGLDFQTIIDNGAKFYLGNNNNPMHNKFCIVDNTTLITGSYNWTYFAEAINQENIIVFKGASDIIEAYVQEFNSLTAGLTLVKSVKDYIQEFPPKKNMFSYSNYASQDLYWFAKREENEGNNMKALKLINFSLSIQSDENIENERKEIHYVVYKQWRKNYIMEKIELIGSEGIFHFKTILNLGFIHGPNAKYSWVLRNTENPLEIYKCYKVSNIMINDICVLDNIDENMLVDIRPTPYYGIPNYTEQGYLLDNNLNPINEAGARISVKKFSVKENSVLKCSVHFKNLSPTLKKVDFIEGQGKDAMTHHWHCFDISLEKGEKND